MCVQVAVRKEARELEAETFALKDAMWAEFDPAFFHMSVQVRTTDEQHHLPASQPAPLHVRRLATCVMPDPLARVLPSCFCHSPRG